MPAFWLTTDEGRKAFDEYRFAFYEKTEREWVREQATRNAKRETLRLAIELELLQQELDREGLELERLDYYPEEHWAW